VQFEAALVIEKIASKTCDHAEVIDELGGIPILVRLLDSPVSLRVALYAFRGLCHLVALPDRGCDAAVLNAGIGPVMVKLLRNPRLPVS
jgi:hypothetical protein